MDPFRDPLEVLEEQRTRSTRELDFLSMINVTDQNPASACMETDDWASQRLDLGGPEGRRGNVQKTNTTWAEEFQQK